MTIAEKDNGVLIDFGNKLNSKIKILFSIGVLGAIPIIATGVNYAYNGMDAGEYLPLGSGIIVIIVGVTIAMRYMARVMSKEYIFVTRDTLVITRTGLDKMVRTFDTDKITNLVYTGKAKKTDHPLKGQSFDYLGFETQELVIADVNDEGNLCFEYEGAICFFGRNVYSWDAEKMSPVLERITGGKLKTGNLPEEMTEEPTADTPTTEEH